MQKVYAVTLAFFLVLGLVLASAFVLAEQGSNNNSDDDDDNENESEEDDDEGNNGKGKNERNKSNDRDDREDDDDDENEIEVEHEFYDQNGTKVKIKIKTKFEDGKNVTEYKISIKGIDAHSKFEIKQITIGNRTILKIKSKGNFEETLNYLPDDILEIVKNALNVNSTDAINITLIESTHKNKSRVVYNVETNDHGRFLGVFKLKIKLETEIDPETGEVIIIRKPWWTFLVAGERKVTICHIPSGDPNNKHTIRVGAPALKAHLALGDTTGACQDVGGNTNTPGNNTNGIPPGNQTTNLTLVIVSPQNITYNITGIPITITSNGNLILYSIDSGNFTNYNSTLIMNFSEGNHTLNAFANNTNGNNINKNVIFSVLINNTIVNNTSNNSTNNSSGWLYNL